MRTKTRSDASWNELSPEQLEKLDQWLFEDNLSFREALAKAQAEVGFKGAMSSLKRYYRRREQERKVEELVELQEDVEGIAEAGTSTERLRQAAMKLVAAQAFQQVRATPEDASKWGPAVKMMVQNDRNETIREGQRIRERLRLGDQEVRREAIEFGRQKYEFDMVAQAVRALPELQKLAEAINDPDPRRYSDRGRWGAARDAMFEAPGGQGGDAGQGGESAGEEAHEKNSKHQAPSARETPSAKGRMMRRRKGVLGCRSKMTQAQCPMTKRPNVRGNPKHPRK